MLLAAVSALSGCGKSAQGTGDAPSGKLRVVCTTAMIGDVAAEIGGDAVAVQTLMGASVDPHLYKPTVVDVKRLSAADVVFFNGLMLEGKMEAVLEKIGRGGKRVSAVAEGLRKSGYVSGGHHPDPHVWMDVAGWKTAAAEISRVLGDALPTEKPAIGKRGGEYLAELERLDAYAKKAIATIPTEKRVLVTAHDAFGYMARAYGLEVRGIQGISTESETGLKDLNELVDFLVERKIPAVFVESSVPRKSVEALVEGTRARGHEVRIGGELFSDAMGNAGTYEGTYIGMIDHNITTIVRALGGNALKRGMDGKLATE